jgi:hypothetical protein
VIGILIAIYLNNLNEEHSNNIKEQKLLTNILADLKANQLLISEVEQEINVEINHTSAIVDIMKENPNDSELIAIDTLLLYGTEVATLELNFAKINSLIDHDIVLIKNVVVKEKISDYVVSFHRYKDVENILRDMTNNRIRPRIKSYLYLNEYIGSVNFSSNRKGLLSDRTLANDFVDRLWESSDWIKKLKILYNNGEKLIESIELELNTRK